jgi:hypothetical protein
MAQLKFFLQLKNFKGGRKSRFFKVTQETFTNWKFWLISVLPFLFFLYNHMRKRKKNRRQKSNFYLGVTLYSLFSVVAVVMIAAIFSGNIHFASGTDGIKADAKSDYSTAYFQNSQFYKTMSDVESYINKNIAILAGANNAGGASSVVDSVDFINVNRALIFYHENTDRYLAEVVFKHNDDRAEIERFILKVKNDNDYSHGVYGAD